MRYEQCKVVAEIGCVHAGDMARAKNLIKLAHLCGADYVKFQKRCPKESVPLELQNKPHPNAMFAYGATYLQHREALEFNINQHKELFDYCSCLGIGYATSVWDRTSAKEVVENIKCDFIKIPSACNSNLHMISYLLDNYAGDIHVSLGMRTKEDRDLQKLFWQQRFAVNTELRSRVVFYHCTSEYPCPFTNLALLEVARLKSEVSTAIGFSNHGFGIAADVAAFILGASWIERHFVDDRTFRHTDASASLEPDGLRKLCRDLKNVYTALTYKKEITPEELRQRDKLRVQEY